MRFNIIYDANWEAKIDEALSNYNSRILEENLYHKNLGSGLSAITIVLMCRDPRLTFKQRIKLSKLEKKLYLDLMLDYTTFINLELQEKRRIIANKVLSELPIILEKYNIKDFDMKRLIDSLHEYFIELKWIEKKSA